jgi:hypothetical protein
VKLQTDLRESLAARERLSAEVGDFTQTIAAFDGEVQKLRDSNRRLIEENEELRENLQVRGEYFVCFCIAC